MQRAVLTLPIVFVLLASAAGASPGLDLRFHPPAQVGPRLQFTGGQWMVLVFSNQTRADGYVHFAAASAGQQFNEAQTYHDFPPVSDGPKDAPAPGLPKQYPPFAANLSYGGGPASLYIEAQAISWNTTGADASLDHHPFFGCLLSYVGQGVYDERSGRYDKLCPGESVNAKLDGAVLPQFKLRAVGVKAVEWHNASLTCAAASSDCPTGGDRQEQRFAAGGGYFIRRQLTFERVNGNGTLEMHGSAAFVMAGGRSLDVAVAGHARLPLASAPPACQGCLAPDGQTFQATGDFTLHGAAIQPDGSLSSHIDGQLANVRFDEAIVAPGALFGIGTAVAAGVAAAVGLGLLVKPLLGSLFTRLRPDAVLRNRNRRAIHEHIEANPGTSFSELRRALGLGVETVRLHLRVLLSAGKVVEQRHGNTRRFFPPGFAETNRTRIILLRTAVLDDLYALVERHTNLSQKELVELAAHDYGWKRATTQHRLGRLISGGLVVARRQGRMVLHAVQAAPGSFRALTPVAPVIQS